MNGAGPQAAWSLRPPPGLHFPIVTSKSGATTNCASGIELPLLLPLGLLTLLWGELVTRVVALAKICKHNGSDLGTAKVVSAKGKVIYSGLALLQVLPLDTMSSCKLTLTVSSNKTPNDEYLFSGLSLLQGLP